MERRRTQPGETPAKLSQIAYQRFKEALFAGRIALGATVSQGELAELLEVQTGTLREAMQRLEQEGFLVVLPRSGIQIVKPDLAHLKDCFQMRRVIEAEALRRFAERVTMGEIVEWRQRHDEIIDLARDGVVESVLFARAAELDRAFHGALVEGTRNPLMITSHAQMMEQICVVRLDTLYMLSSLAIVHTMQEHLAVLSALEAQDPEAAVTAMEAHLARSMHRAMGL
ncbi:GntR family transcriptional regulator [Kaistia sp. 32K]|uniref:GntR family transcriptional regulator n=1 Tax=Kaistia sp. 32K TaxID=2795690 RepID=UPI0019162373|nr:GntR family transcriptional regulator [Kaistia sp. 32K]BCP55753.1 GntR family transcriptional regulator [Kaistia sp. 32K]